MRFNARLTGRCRHCGIYSIQPVTITLSGVGILVAIVFLLLGCDTSPWNDPYPASDEGRNIVYASFTEPPKHLDPVSSYSSNEYEFIGQIYEPPLQYHYLKRPYKLVPLTSESVPAPVYFGFDGQILPASAPPGEIAYSVYKIRIKPGIRYQPHPAFARHSNGAFRYHDLSDDELKSIRRLEDFEFSDTRELVAADYVYQIKRLAHPGVHSPIAGLMSDYIVGLREFMDTLKNEYEKAEKESGSGAYLDLAPYPLEGVEASGRYTYRITIKGKYPQFLYWLAMPFFAPMPWEAVQFYSQTGLVKRNITLDWYPVGTGAFMLVENNPNRRMVLGRNPNFRRELYPEEGEAGDYEAGLLRDSGSPLPFVENAVFSLEKESIPHWNKFLQGYYDTSGVNSDSFDQAIRFGDQGDPEVTQVLQGKGIRLQTAIRASIYYTGFNMRDPVVGGYSERSRKLRRAIALAVDFEEFISIFANGRGVPAQGPIPPGIFGYKPGKRGLNRYLYEWRDNKPKRKVIEVAQTLLAEAGYPNGRDLNTGKPLVLHLDTHLTGPDGKARMDWLRKQFDKLNVQLVVRATDYNRFQEKMRRGAAQIFQWGWNADYPDPENFLFLFHGPNAKVVSDGENASNYQNPEFDALFNKMKNMDNTPERQGTIDRMVEILREDGPWLWGYHPMAFSLEHAWYQNAKPALMANNTLKYIRINAGLRSDSRRVWNRPVFWPLALILGLALIGIAPAVFTYRRRQKAAVK